MPKRGMEGFIESWILPILGIVIIVVMLLRQEDIPTNWMITAFVFLGLGKILASVLSAMSGFNSGAKERNERTYSTNGETASKDSTGDTDSELPKNSRTRWSYYRSLLSLRSSCRNFVRP